MNVRELWREIESEAKERKASPEPTMPTQKTTELRTGKFCYLADCGPLRVFDEEGDHRFDLNEGDDDLAERICTSLNSHAALVEALECYHLRESKKGKSEGRDEGLLRLSTDALASARP